MNKQKTTRRLATLAATSVLGGSLVAIGALATASPAAAADAPLNCADSTVEKKLANGASWRMCARIHPIKGLILEKVEYKPPTDREYSGYKRVLDQIGMAQLNVPYNTGHVQYNDITSYGFGKQYLIEQTENTCQGETHDVPQSFTYRNELVERTIKGICTDEVSTGLATHAQENQLGGGVLYADQGSALEVSSIAKISWYEYQQNIKFDDHGQIEVGLGATGDIAPGAPGSNFFTTDPKTGWPLGGAKTTEGGDTYASSHWHNAIWKVDFGIDQGERQLVEQWDFSSPGEGTRAPIVHGEPTMHTKAFSAVPGTDTDELSWFRVLNPNSKNPDGHARSYEIVNPNYNNKLIPVFQPTVTFTNARACEEYASANLNAGCPNESILDYVAKDQNHDLTDPVAWVNVGFHHTDKDEDQSPMPIHWQKFQLVPRDFFAQKPTITDARACVNGATGGAVNTVTRPCIATNTELPVVTADAETPVVGTTLSATPGLWNESRTTWNYQYLWFRDGEPILVADGEGNETGAMGTSYTLTAADLGKKITVKVTASQTGYPSGTAESAAITVPGGPVTQPEPGPVASKIKVSAGTLKAGKKGTITATVTAPGTTPTGKVTARKGSTTLGSATLSGGKAKITLKALKKKGSHKVTVTYGGSSKVKASSVTITLKVK
ncbi:Ig-like domain repeat protein [Nocardioides dubius]|uniref:Amine oxidase n=1 Tax=Nocardioides dubius TaxID=317019 RepID=A0ABP4EAZ4_9ACTN